jgi:hypothetical protein
VCLMEHYFLEEESGESMGSSLIESRLGRPSKLKSTEILGLTFFYCALSFSLIKLTFFFFKAPYRFTTSFILLNGSYRRIINK